MFRAETIGPRFTLSHHPASRTMPFPAGLNAPAVNSSGTLFACASASASHGGAVHDNSETGLPVQASSDANVHHP